MLILATKSIGNSWKTDSNKELLSAMREVLYSYDVQNNKKSFTRKFPFLAINAAFV